MKIRKATTEEKWNYAEGKSERYTGERKPLYPLFGYLTLEGKVIPVEYLGEGEGEPNYEAIAPKGFHFDNGDILHTMLGTTQRDLTDRLGHLAPCDEECG